MEGLQSAVSSDVLVKRWPLPSLVPTAPVPCALQSRIVSSVQEHNYTTRLNFTQPTLHEQRTFYMNHNYWCMLASHFKADQNLADCLAWRCYFDHDGATITPSDLRTRRQCGNLNLEGLACSLYGALQKSLEYYYY